VRQGARRSGRTNASCQGPLTRSAPDANRVAVVLTARLLIRVFILAGAVVVANLGDT